jgi:Thioredoxin
MTVDASPDDRELTLAPLDEKVDHVRGSPAGRLIIEYGDYECPYSRQAFHAIEQVEQQLGGNVRFAFRQFPLTRIHPHALAAATAEAAARQGRFWGMHGLLFHRQKALEDGDLLRYAAQHGLDVAAFGRDRASAAVLERIQRDVDSGLASGQVLGTPPCSSTASCTAAATTRPPCRRHWPLQTDQKPRRSLTMIAVTRPGVTALLMMRMLFTPLGTP